MLVISNRPQLRAHLILKLLVRLLLNCTPLGPISITNYIRDKQIGLPLRGRPILLLLESMITDRIRLHSVLLPLESNDQEKNSSIFYNCSAAMCFPPH